MTHPQKKGNTKQQTRLNARIKDWESIKGNHSEKVCMVNKSCFTKPGSLKK